MTDSLQLILSLILTLGEYPYFQVANNEDICKKVVNGLTLNIPEHCPKSIKNVMTLSWKYFPFERCSFEDIMSIIVEAKPIDNISYAPIHLPYQACETLPTSSGIGSEDLESTTEQTVNNPLMESNKYVSTNLHEQSSKKQKLCLLAIVLLVLTVICVGIGVPLSYYNGKSWTSEYDFVVRNSSLTSQTKRFYYRRPRDSSYTMKTKQEPV